MRITNKISWLGTWARKLKNSRKQPWSQMCFNWNTKLIRFKTPKHVIFYSHSHWIEHKSILTLRMMALTIIAIQFIRSYFKHWFALEFNHWTSFHFGIFKINWLPWLFWHTARHLFDRHLYKLWVDKLQ